MADPTFQNVVNGELVDSASGETYDVIDPTTGEVYAQAPMSGAEDVDRAYAAADAAFEAWGDTTPQDRANALLKIADAIEARVEEINARRVPRHRQAARADDVGGDALRLRPLPLLRRRRAGARGPLGRRVHGRPHVVDPSRAGRRRRPGDAVELPADDDDLEDRAGAGRRQHDRPQAQRHHARELDAAGRALPGVPAAGRAQRRLRRPRHRPRAGRAQDARRWSRSPARSAPAWRSPARRPPTSSGSTSSSAARRR